MVCNRMQKKNVPLVKQNVKKLEDFILGRQGIDQCLDNTTQLTHCLVEPGRKSGLSRQRQPVSHALPNNEDSTKYTTHNLNT